jgi:hypothetical protein
MSGLTQSEKLQDSGNASISKRGQKYYISQYQIMRADHGHKNENMSFTCNFHTNAVLN